MMQTVSIRGPLTDDEVREIVEVLQRIESRHPDETFQVFINSPESEAEVNDMLEKVNPLRYGYERVVKTRKL